MKGLDCQFAVVVSVWGPEAVILVQHVSFGSVDHFVGADQDGGRNRQAELCRCSRTQGLTEPPTRWLNICCKSS